MKSNNNNKRILKNPFKYLFCAFMCFPRCKAKLESEIGSEQKKMDMKIDESE